MSAHWKFLLRCIRDDPTQYEEIIPTIYNIIRDYHEQKIDTICDSLQMRELEQIICDIDPEWAEQEIEDVDYCDHCNELYLCEDLSKWRLIHDRLDVIHDLCSDCRTNHKEYYTKYDEDADEEPIDDLIERHIETQVEISMGK